MDPQGLLYFAYGEHMNEVEMLRLFPHARDAGCARLQGFRLCFVGRDGQARAALETCPGHSVPGRLWSLRAEDAGTLDREANAPYFARGEVRFFAVEGTQIPALVYITSPGQSMGRPGFVTYDIMREAYAMAGEGSETLRTLAMESIP